MATRYSDFEPRLMARVSKDDDGCWRWRGPLNNAGYSQVSYKGKMHPGHRLMCERYNGDIPDGFWVDHLCKTRNCINPEHLEAVTPRTNTLRGDTIPAENVKKKHCPQGHPLVKGNLRGYELKRGVRSCLTCHRERERAQSQEV